MKSYEFIANELQIRSSQDKSKPKYSISGYAVVPNKMDTYGYEHTKDGKVTKTFKSMFTPHCIESIKKQAKHKRLFVDGMHEKFLNANLRKLVETKLSKEEMNTFERFLKGKKLPLAKLNDIEIDEKGLFIDTELNPVFATLDEEHKTYFDAVWYSLD